MTKHMRYTHAFFDLDGTLTDSAQGIVHSVQYALRGMGIDPPPDEALTGFIGPPLLWGFSHYFGMTEEESQRAVALYREYYTAGGMLENRVYEGLPELLEALTDMGVSCVLATSKPHVYASAILRHFCLDRYFSFVSGPELDGTRNEKSEVIAYAVEQLKLPDTKCILMIGDRCHDVLGAKEHGIDCAGVLWGFGTEAELRDAGARYICDTVDALKELFAVSLPNFSKNT